MFCLLTGIDEENGYDLDREEKWWVLQEIGESSIWLL